MDTGQRALSAAAGIVLSFCLTTGCSPTDRSPGFGAVSGHTAAAVVAKPLPFASLIDKLPQLPAEELRAQLKAVLASDSEPDVAKREAAYMLARILQKSADPDDQKEALKLFQEASRQEPLWERCQWHISECAAALGDEKTVQRALEAVRERAGDQNSKAAAEYALAQSYLRANEPGRAREAFAAVASRYRQTQYALGAAYYMGESLIDSPEGRPEALRLFRLYLARSPDGRFSRTILDRLAHLPDFTPTASDRDLFGQVHYVHGEWQQALAQWNGSDAGRRWLERATCLLRLGQTGEGKAALRSGIERHANDPALPEAAATLCRFLSRQEAFSLWQRILERSSRHDDTALWNLALRSSPAQALAFYRRIVAAHPSSDYAPESSWWLTWRDIQAGRHAQALAGAQAALRRYPHARAAPRFSFWIAKLHERLGKKEAARLAYKRTREKFPAHYYGYRAQARLAALSGSNDRGWTTRPGRRHPQPDWDWPNPPRLISWQAVAADCGVTQALLARLGQWEECLELLPEHVAPVFKSWLLARLNLPLDAINTMFKGLGGAARHSPDWELAYPLLYGRVVSAEAAAHKIDPLLVHALIREESRYNHLALSRSNAIGLMQLLPGTAYGVAKRLGVRLAGTERIHDPPTNIKLGTAYLASTLKRAGGNALLAVAGYNGGPNAVHAWHNRFRQRGVCDFDVFVEEIPFTETRDYVRKVFGTFWNYERVYGK